jgi:glycine dehydrogenase subunit 2
MTLGKEGISEASANAVLNANYMKQELSDTFNMAYDGICMHEFVMSLEQLKHDYNVSALDVAKAMLDYGIHPPTMYFPLIVHEALMVEPTETEGKAQMDEAIKIYKEIYKTAIENPDIMHEMPLNTVVRRLDEVLAARKPILRYQAE